MIGSVLRSKSLTLIIYNSFNKIQITKMNLRIELNHITKINFVLINKKYKSIKGIFRNYK